MKNVCFRLKPRQHFEDGEFFNNFPNDVCNFSVGKVLPKWNFSRDVKPIEKNIVPWIIRSNPRSENKPNAKNMHY